MFIASFIDFVFNLKKQQCTNLTIINSTFKTPMMTSPKRTWYDVDFDNNNNNNNDNFDNADEKKCMEDINNTMKNTTVSDDMRTVTLHSGNCDCT